MLRKGGRTEKRLKRLVAGIYRPAWSEVAGVQLPLKHPVVTPSVRKDIYLGGYEQKEIVIIRRKLEPSDVVMEVGAGIGFLSAYCAKIVGDQNVFAYEANPALIDLIHAVHQKNKVAPHVINAILAPEEGEREFFVEKDFWASSLVRRSTEAQVIRVRQLDLNSEIRRIKPSFLILDIEGGEYEFFRHADLTGIRKLCFESHPDILGDEGVSQILGWLFSAGFALDLACTQKNVCYLYRATVEK